FRRVLFRSREPGYSSPYSSSPTVPAPASDVWAAARPRQRQILYTSLNPAAFGGILAVRARVAPNFRRRSRFRTDGPIALMTVMRNAAPDSLCHGRVDDQEPS